LNLLNYNTKDMNPFKTYFVAVFSLLLPPIINAQSTPEAFLSQLPPIPNIVCAADSSVANRFTDRIYQVKTNLKEVIDHIHANAQSDMESNKNKIVSNAIRQSGLNKSDVQRLQESDGSEEQGHKAAEKVVSEQYGVSLQDLEKVGEMSDADQEEWAQNYANSMMQQAKQTPQATVKKQEKSARLFELAKEQKAIGERIMEKMTKVDKLFKNIEQQDTIETRKLNEKLSPLEKQLCSGICSPAEIAKSRAAEKQIYNLKLQYCEKMSPLQIDAISQYLTSVKTLLHDYRRLTEVQNEIVKLQFGEIIPENLSCYSAVDEYSNVLLAAYKYWVGKFEQ